MLRGLGGRHRLHTTATMTFARGKNPYRARRFYQAADELRIGEAAGRASAPLQRPVAAAMTPLESEKARACSLLPIAPSKFG